MIKYVPFSAQSRIAGAGWKSLTEENKEAYSQEAKAISESPQLRAALLDEIKRQVPNREDEADLMEVYGLPAVDMHSPSDGGYLVGETPESSSEESSSGEEDEDNGGSEGSEGGGGSEGDEIEAITGDGNEEEEEKDDGEESEEGSNTGEGEEDYLLDFLKEGPFFELEESQDNWPYF